MHDRRQFLAVAGAGLLGSVSPTPASSGATTDPASARHGLEIDGVRVRWRHAADRFAIRLDTPSPGWLALGVNDSRALAGTRFVIADVAGPLVRAEERVALLPGHVAVATLGLAPILLEAGGHYREGRATLALELEPAIDERPRLRLRSGSRLHLMLAWSHESDFEHHSAWRRHVPVEL